jgi:hypothetical protein
VLGPNRTDWGFAFFAITDLASGSSGELFLEEDADDEPEEDMAKELQS